MELIKKNTLSSRMWFPMKSVSFLLGSLIPFANKQEDIHFYHSRKLFHPLPTPFSHLFSKESGATICFPISPIRRNHTTQINACSLRLYWGMSKRDSPARLLAKDLIAGCFGGIGIVAVGHPFDTIKVHILYNLFLRLFLLPSFCTSSDSESEEPPVHRYGWLYQEDHEVGGSWWTLQGLHFSSLG